MPPIIPIIYRTKTKTKTKTMVMNLTKTHDVSENLVALVSGRRWNQFW